MSWLLIVGLKNAVLVVPLALAALAAGRCFRRPALAHVLWVLVLVKLLTPPLVDVPVGWTVDVGPWLAEISTQQSETAQAPPAADQVLQPAGTPFRPSSPHPLASSAVACEVTPSVAGQPKARAAVCSPTPAWPLVPQTAGQWLAIVGGIWLCGSALTAALMLRRALRFRRFLRLAARDDNRLIGRVRQLAFGVGLIKPPAVIVVEGVVSPMLWGLGSRVQLVFPARLAERLTPGEVDALLLHELAHYARGDYWVRLVELVAHVAYWWHPVVWWARREIETAEEQCCDAWVVQHQRGTRLSYAEALLATIDFLCEPAVRQRTLPLPPAACGLGDVPLLRVRLKQIMRGELGGQLSRTAWVAVLGAGLVLSPLEPAVLATSTRERLATVRPASRDRLDVGRADDLPPPAVRDEIVSLSPVSPALAAPPVVQPAEARPVSVLVASAPSPDGNYRLEARTGREAMLIHRDGFRLGLSSHRFTCAAFAPDSRSFVTGHEDGQLKLWDSVTGVTLATLRVGASPIVSVGFSPSGAHVAAGASDGAVSVWDMAAQNEIDRLPNPGIVVGCLRWSPDGSRLAVALGSWTSTDDARLVVWSLAGGDLTEQALVRPVGALDWLSADALLLADWTGGASVRFLDGERPGLQMQLDKNLVSAAHWSPDCRLVTAWDARELVAGAAR